MRAILDRRPNRDGYVFSTDGGASPYLYWTVYHAFVRARKRAGVAGFQPKDLRRTQATRLDERGVHLEEIQVLLGHASARMTEWYLSRPQDRIKLLKDVLDRTSDGPDSARNMPVAGRAV